MKRAILTAALVALALSGCESLRERLGMGTDDKPVVSVVNGKINVSPEELRFGRDRRNVNIIWRLNDSSFRFVADSGIRIDGEVVPGKPLDRGQTEVVDCRVVGDGRQFMCLNKNTRPGTYKYTIRLIAPNGDVIERDPFIFNDR